MRHVNLCVLFTTFLMLCRHGMSRRTKMKFQEELHDIVLA